MVRIILPIPDFSFAQVARETNEELRNIHADPAEGFDIGAILSIARRCIFSLSTGKQLGLKVIGHL